MKLYYLYDPAVRDTYNERGYDYSPAYLPAICAFLGASASPITSKELSRLLPDDVLLIGAQQIEALPDCRCILMGTCVGKDAPVAVREERIFAHYFTENGKELPLFVPLSSPILIGRTVAYAIADGEKHPALVSDGQNWEFCFDLCASVWFSGDGYVPSKPSSYFSIGRTPDLRPLKSMLSPDAFNDFLLGELEDILRKMGIPMLYRLTPVNGGIPDAMIHVSGDDDCTSGEINREAMERMTRFGIPYHINAMPTKEKGFVCNRAMLETWEAAGNEIALHLDLTDSNPYTEAEHIRQVELFEKQFGKHPETNVNHYLVQGGTSAERLRWLEICGLLADNSKLGIFNPENINAFDLCGFGFGTAFPRYTCDDALHKNRMISTAEIPLTYYEPRLYEEDSDSTKIRSYIDEACRHGRIIQFFLHPHYLSSYYGKKIAATERVLKTILEHTAGKPILFTTTNKIARFWKARSNSRIEQSENELRISAKTDLILTLPPTLAKKALTLDGNPIKTHEKTVSGRQLTLVCIPCGDHIIATQ